MTLYIIAGIVAVLVAALWMFARRMRQVGETKVVADVATAAVDVMVKQDRAAADAAAEDTVDRLRRGGF